MTGHLEEDYVGMALAELDANQRNRAVRELKAWSRGFFARVAAYTGVGDPPDLTAELLAETRRRVDRDDPARGVFLAACLRSDVLDDLRPIETHFEQENP